MKSKKQISEDSDNDTLSQNSDQLDTDNSPKFIPVARLGDKLRTKRIVINISDTQYPIVEEVAQQLGWVVQTQAGPGDWDVWWTDRQISPSGFFRMNFHQKINHYPGIFVLARKNLLGLNLMAMKQEFPDQYNFFPQTWVMPLQFSQFRQCYENVPKGKARTYIVKPQALSQGRGIFLTRNIDDILNGRKYVIQRYIKNPFLIEDLKFDLRIYVLVAGVEPLRLYLYEEGLTRFATQKYEAPNEDNLNKNFIHLTNYSLNKSNPNYEYNISDKEMDKGHKRTLTSTYEKLRSMGCDVERLKQEIEDVITKTVITGLPHINHLYKWSQPENHESNMCFHILGFDVMLTADLKPIVIEVNHTPSFETGTPLDYLVKKKLIKDTLLLMRITETNKKALYEKAKELVKKRIQTGKRQILKGSLRTVETQKATLMRNEAQKELLGGYKMIHPVQDQEKQSLYNAFYIEAQAVEQKGKETRKRLLKQDSSKEKESKKAKTNESPLKKGATCGRKFSDSTDINCQKNTNTNKNYRFRTKITKRSSVSERFHNIQAKQKITNVAKKCQREESPYCPECTEPQVSDLARIKEALCPRKCGYATANGKFQCRQGTFLIPKTYFLCKKVSTQEKKQLSLGGNFNEDAKLISYYGPKGNTKIRRLSIF